RSKAKPAMEDPVNSPLSFQEGKRSHQSPAPTASPKTIEECDDSKASEARAYDDAQQAEQISRFHREQANRGAAPRPLFDRHGSSNESVVRSVEPASPFEVGCLPESQSNEGNARTPGNSFF